MESVAFIKFVDFVTLWHMANILFLFKSFFFYWVLNMVLLITDLIVPTNHLTFKRLAGAYVKPTYKVIDTETVMGCDLNRQLASHFTISLAVYINDHFIKPFVPSKFNVPHFFNGDYWG